MSNAATPVPTTLPQIVWRAGLDLNPLDAPDAEQAEWLKTLVWPEQTYRLANLEAALKIAAAQKPRIERGDLRGDVLEHLCGEAPPDATLVIFHTVVLVYVPARSDREEFCERAMSLCDYWMANENPRLLPNISARAGVAAPPSRYVLSVNDSPVAWADPHGTVLDWFGSSDEWRSRADSLTTGRTP